MSNPPNQLSQYATYSYHHILVVCSTTEIAEALANSTAIYDQIDSVRNAQNATSLEEPLAKYVAVDFNNGKVKGKYVILIDGTRDAEFVIQKVNWYQTTAGKTHLGTTSFQTLAADGEMVVEEPRGVRLLNVMRFVASQLGTDSTGMIFVLKTIFVGHRTPSDLSGSTDFIDPITTVRPFLFYMYDITGSFTISGGIYTLRFAGINGGMSKMQQIKQASQQVSLNLSQSVGDCEPNTLYGAMCKLEKRINDLYETHYLEVKNKIESEGLRFSGRRVEYKIRLEEPYVKYKRDSNGKVLRRGDRSPIIDSGNPAYIVDDFKKQATDKGVKNEAGIIDLGQNPSVEAAIMAIVNRCSRVQDDLAKQKKEENSFRKMRYTPKVISTIRSNDEKVQVIYKVRQFFEGRNDIIERLQNRPSNSISDLDADILSNLLVLDYIYTGKNTDILDLDINLEMGTAFFQTLITTDTIPGANQAITGGIATNKIGADGTSKIPRGGTEGKITDTKTISESMPRTPIFFDTLVTDRMITNAKDPKRSSEFKQLLARHAAFENIDIELKIAGNPALLNSMGILPSEMDARTSQADTEAVSDREADFPDVFPHWTSIPAIVKINIKMPSTDTDAEDYAENFWYDGFYYCYAIENTFDAGLFTQTLSMVSLPIDESEEKRQKSKAQAQPEREKDDAENARKSSPTRTVAGSQQAVLMDDPATVSSSRYIQAHFREDEDCQISG
jgi:hypothetical protein